MKNKHLKHMATSVAITLFALATPFAATSGLEVMQEVYTRDSGNNMSANLVMTLTNSRGSTRERSIQQFRQTDDGGEKKIMFFLAPSDVKDTSFLSYSYSDGRSDDQWIYLPALKRTKRISSDGKSDSFMGSDFTYDYLGDRHPNQDNHKLLREETVDGKDCYVVESTPKEDDYMYSKTITWVMKDNYLGLKREFYDDRGKLLKVLTIKKYEKVDGFWTILETEMHNVQKDHRTNMKFTDVQKNKGIPNSKFTERSMMLGS
ncbi:MAG TPA: outer membrane lipoprotein-sorting protein [Sphaerochaeta sp.]|nr:outer membrane lipoprotein-sorting protein [Sphaerochaeta sp.]